MGTQFSIDDMRVEIWNLDFEASMNQNYHRRMRDRWRRKNRIIKFTIAALAALSLVLTLAPSLPVNQSVAFWGGVLVAVGSLGAAIWLNVKDYCIPAAHHEELFRQWSHLLGDICDLRATVESVASSSKTVPSGILSKWSTLKQYQSRIELAEPDEPDGKTLRECYEDENQRRWGARTHEAVLKLRSEGVKPNWPGVKPEKIVPPKQPV